MKVRIEPSWGSRLEAEWDKDYFARLVEFVKSEYATKRIFPPASRIFAAFDACPWDDLKVVILGQDPYHDDGQANGLCFSVAPGVAMPPSLVNIFKEVRDDTGAPIPADGDLTRWARQGVLLLNSALTVEAHMAGSHRGKGWEEFTDNVIKLISDQKEHVVFILWGGWARSKKDLIDTTRHLVLTSAHPSPLSAHRGFFGNHHFSLANDFLLRNGMTPVKW